MKIPKQLHDVFSPPAEKSQLRTGLQFTDILFGFVISQIFLRLQNWAVLSHFSRWQLICSAALVLGSWIGFRRSLNRSEYELKFFNMPLFRFLLDQIMLIFYFRVATLTPRDPDKSVNVPAVTHDTIKALLFVFALYLLWDIVGQIMAWTTAKYDSKRDLIAPAITIVSLAGVGVLLHVVDSATTFDANLLMALSTGLLIGYRWLKDIRTTLRGAGTPHAPSHCPGCPSS
jgi:hypothetical protein